jgi:hypothetical protein
MKKLFMILQIARLCHEANREYCKTIGDPEQSSWEDAPLWMKISSVKGVLLHLYYYPAVNPQKSHESWLREKEATGWKYGEVKDAEAKTHPCFLPYNDLPVEQRLKDTLFINIVHAVIKTVGLDGIQPNLIEGRPDEKRNKTYIRDIEPTPELIAEVEKSCWKPDTPNWEEQIAEWKQKAEDIEKKGEAKVLELQEAIKELQKTLDAPKEVAKDAKPQAGALKKPRSHH